MSQTKYIAFVWNEELTKNLFWIPKHITHCRAIERPGQRTAARWVRECCTDFVEQHDQRSTWHVRVVGEERGQPGRSEAHRGWRHPCWLEAQRQLSVASKHTKRIHIIYKLAWNVVQYANLWANEEDIKQQTVPNNKAINFDVMDDEMVYDYDSTITTVLTYELYSFIQVRWSVLINRLEVAQIRKKPNNALICWCMDLSILLVCSASLYYLVHCSHFGSRSSRVSIKPTHNPPAF